jgi:diacylglycerol kinase (ATP)
VRRLPVVLNPAARGGRYRPPLRALERAAAERGLTLEWWPTERPGHATELAARAIAEGLPTLAAWGGDGTYNEVAQGLVGSDTALLALPGGTTSVLGYELGIPRDPVRALDAQLAGERAAMAIGRTSHGRVFLLMVSVGPDSVILAHVPGFLKRRAGKVGIGVQACVELLRGGLPRVVVRADGVAVDASWCIVGNGRCYGGDFHATPGADPFSRGLEVVTLARHGRRAVVPFFFAIPSGRHLAMPGVERRAALEVELTGDPSVPYQLDGDHAGFLPVRLNATDEQLWVLLPAAQGRGTAG